MDFPASCIFGYRSGIGLPIGSMYGIVTYIWLKFMGNVGEYSIRGSYGVQTGFKAVFLVGSGCSSTD